jgi:hypothetical protein
MSAQPVMFTFGQSTEAGRREYARCHRCGKQWRGRIGKAWARAEAHDCPQTLVCNCDACERKRAAASGEEHEAPASTRERGPAAEGQEHPPR